jgi:hypothetical protein
MRITVIHPRLMRIPFTAARSLWSAYARIEVDVAPGHVPSLPVAETGSQTELDEHRFA